MAVLKLRRGTAAEWTSADPILADGEVGYERDTKKQKIGDGTSHWSTQPYFINEYDIRSSVVSDALSSGQETFSRRNINSSAVTSGATQRMILSYLTARKSETITKIRMISGGTAAGTPTLIRLALFIEAANGDLTRVAASVNDTALFAAQNTTYTKSLSAGYDVKSGTRYAVGVLVVASVIPTFHGCSSIVDSEAVIFPRIGGTVNSLADLPTSVASASIQSTNAHFQPYAVLVP